MAAKFDTTGMDAAAEQAEVEIRKLANDPKATARDLMAAHRAWFMQAGHKRLGRIYVKIAKEMEL